MADSAAGVVTAAFGARKYLEMAIDLGLSLGRVSSLPLTVVTTPAGAAYLANRGGNAIASTIALPSLEREKGKGRYLAAKLECLRNSPYERSIFLDADMVCIKDPEFLLDGLDRGKVRVHGRSHNRESCANVLHHGILIRELIDQLHLDVYTYCSLAAFAFDRVGGRRLAGLMERERETWSSRTAECFGDILYDEILLGVLGSRSEVDFFRNPERAYQILDMSFRWRGEFSFIHPGPMRNRETVRVLYGIIGRRVGARQPITPALYWLSDILSRRADQAGKSRRQAHFVRQIVRRALDCDPSKTIV